MYTVTDAIVKGKRIYGGKQVAEVEVAVKERPEKLIVFLEPASAGYNVVQAWIDQSAFALDWYENSLHQAFMEIDTSTFGSQPESGESASLGEQIVAIAGAQLDQLFAAT